MYNSVSAIVPQHPIHARQEGAVTMFRILKIAYLFLVSLASHISSSAIFVTILRPLRGGRINLWWAVSVIFIKLFISLLVLVQFNWYRDADNQVCCSRRRSCR